MIYVGKDNTVKVGLLNDGEPIEPNIVTRAVFELRSAGVSLDTDVDEEVELVEDNTAILVKYGPKFEGLQPRTYLAKLSCYDNVHTNGLAWASVRLTIEKW